jgi:hypothetical protein
MLKKIIPFSLAALLLAAAITSVSAQGPIGTTGGPHIQFAGCVYYEHENFGGGSNSIRDGIRRKLGSEWNDTISSIACNPYCEVTVYEHRDFNGAHRTFRGNISFVGEAWNDEISALVARCSR